MSRISRVLESIDCEITQGYRKNEHDGIDIVKKDYKLDNIVAHSNGKIVQVVKDCLINTNGKDGNILDKNNPGNMVKIDHGNGYYTRYLHLEYGSIKVNVGDVIKKGTVLGYMGNTGYSFGGHLHFEVWKDDVRIDPTKYLEEDFPKNDIINYTKYKIGDIVTINGVYVSSNSTNKLKPAIIEGKITKIIEDVRNPYLLNDGKIGWVNNECIISKNNIKYLSNKKYKGVSIVDALKQINVDSSYNYRLKLAKLNGINNYIGSASQNTKLLELLKLGKLKQN